MIKIYHFRICRIFDQYTLTDLLIIDPIKAHIVISGFISITCDYRHLLQLHHVHGGQQCGDHHHDPQLPPQTIRHASHALLGKDRSNLII